MWLWWLVFHLRLLREHINLSLFMLHLTCSSDPIHQSIESSRLGSPRWHTSWVCGLSWWLPVQVYCSTTCWAAGSSAPALISHEAFLLCPPTPLGHVQRKAGGGDGERCPLSYLRRTVPHISGRSRERAGRRSRRKASAPCRGSCSSNASAWRCHGLRNRAWWGAPVPPVLSGRGGWTSQLPRQGEES